MKVIINNITIITSMIMVKQWLQNDSDAVTAGSAMLTP